MHRLMNNFTSLSKHSSGLEKTSHYSACTSTECSDLNLEPWTEPAGSICVCVVVVSALRGSNIMRPFYIVYCACTVILAGTGDCRMFATECKI